MTAKTTKASRFAQNVMPTATEAESGTRIGSNASRRRVPPSLDDRRQHLGDGVDEEQEEQDPDQQEEREVLGLVRRPEEVREDEPEHAEVRERLDERPDVAERASLYLDLEVDRSDDTEHAEVVGDPVSL